ncbi:uncharacterized protein LOC105195994 isoform X2 [Solenopsis invicta]|nr:uncharacterized protein LOC105195994 isoform X2 [Solenopsis invicta]
MKNIDTAEEKKEMWGIMLLNRMGPIGQEIHRSIEEIHKTLPFYDKNTREDVNALIKKFDIYCVESVFKDKKRDCKDVDEYVHDLHFIAITRKYIDPAEIVKEKIIQDIIYVQRFTGKAALLIQSKGENLIPYLQSLELNDIVLFWKQCDNLMARKIEKTPNQNSYVKPHISIEYTRYGKEYNQSKCPAWGPLFRLCSRCKHKRFNHFTNNSKVKYIDNCNNCGMGHIQSRCPAYGESCTKCGKKNHFSLKCETSFVNNCTRCGINHATSMCSSARSNESVI